MAIDPRVSQVQDAAEDPIQRLLARVGDLERELSALRRGGAGLNALVDGKLAGGWTDIVAGPGFAINWSDYNPGAEPRVGFRDRGDGTAELRGLGNCAVSPATSLVFTLPAESGCRPTEGRRFPVTASDNTYAVYAHVGTDGRVQVFANPALAPGGAGTWVSFDGARYSL